MSPDKPIQIDLASILRSRLGRRSRYVPKFLIRRLEKLICAKELNRLLEHNFPKRGAEFCEGVLHDLDVQLDIIHPERMPESPRCIIVCNHPLGGLDGIAMIAWLSRHYGTPVHFVVNDLLMAVEPLKECFIPINKHGAQSRATSGSLDEALAGDWPVVIYPAGLVSRLGDDGRIADLQWNKMFVNKAVEYHRDVVPVHFSGHNSRSFYSFARRRKRLGLKFNFEMLLLPREIFRSRGSRFVLTCGNTISHSTLKGGAKAVEQAAEIRAAVYELSKNQ
ncbi:MAG: 1-acyl-sn-glycerol-3-phosphate acyltransferase [Muribaculaceae bacterium]|nr:1-acyl-sn-glycerol-3-phosphate acyltransferase [Muribaculaceae bacterium]